MHAKYCAFGVAVRAALLAKGITNTELAKKLGISGAYLGDIFRGVRAGRPQRKKILEIVGLDRDPEEDLAQQ
jgi:transcriptional regulator with XRE-family HTH domain